MIKDIGELKERITIEQPSYSQDATGEPVESWTTYSTVWAKVEMNVTTGGEEMQGDQKTNVKPTVFTVRLDDSINEVMRIVYRSATYQILNVAEVQNRTFQVIESEKYS